MASIGIRMNFDIKLPTSVKCKIISISNMKLVQKGKTLCRRLQFKDNSSLNLATKSWNMKENKFHDANL